MYGGNSFLVECADAVSGATALSRICHTRKPPISFSLAHEGIDSSTGGKTVGQFLNSFSTFLTARCYSMPVFELRAPPFRFSVWVLHFQSHAPCICHIASAAACHNCAQLNACKNVLSCKRASRLICEVRCSVDFFCWRCSLMSLSSCSKKIIKIIKELQRNSRIRIRSTWVKKILLGNFWHSLSAEQKNLCWVIHCSHIAFHANRNESQWHDFAFLN